MRILLASIAFALLAAASSAQTPRKIVTGRFSVVLPPGEPKDETTTQDWFLLPSAKKEVEVWTQDRCSSCKKEVELFHSFASIQYNKVFLVGYGDYPAFCTDCELLDAPKHEPGVVVTDVKKGVRHGLGFITYKVTKNTSDIGPVVEYCFFMYDARWARQITHDPPTIRDAKTLRYVLTAMGPLYDAPTPKEASDFFDSFTLLK
ncbi:MAG: hypothetical protein WBX16_15630 [Candidatus Acidiferrales bacterium]